MNDTSPDFTHDHDRSDATERPGVVVLAALVAVVALAYPVHAFWTWQALREGLPHVSVRRLQVRYRVLYAGIGLAMVTSLLLV